jgi:hypothetical protein
MWSDQATARLVAGVPFRTIVAEAGKENFRTNTASLSRHRKHIILDKPVSAVDVPLPRASNIEILEAIIAKGFDNRKNWKPTISDTMKAMDMWFRLTQGNPFDELLDTLASAGIGEENPAALDGETPVREMPEPEEEPD